MISENSWLTPGAGSKIQPLFNGVRGGGKSADAAAAMATTHFTTRILSIELQVV
jgi:hypothetical protein